MAVEKKYKKNNVKKTGNSKKSNSASKSTVRKKSSKTSNKVATKKKNAGSSKTTTKKNNVKNSSSKASVKKRSSKVNTSKKNINNEDIIEKKQLLSNNDKVDKINTDLILEEYEIIKVDNSDLITIDNTLKSDEFTGENNRNLILDYTTEEDISEELLLKDDTSFIDNEKELLLDNTTDNENKRDKLILEEDKVTDNIIVDSDKDEELILVEKENEIKNEVNSLMLDTFLEDNKIIHKKKKNKKTFVILVLVLAFIFVLDAIFFPRLELIGDEELVISYKDRYVEPGYRASVYKKDISDSIYIDSNVNDGVVGEYEINYYLDLLGAKLKKTRYVKIVDQDKPNIMVDSDSIIACPNALEIPTIKYSANDEYDGNITDLVIRKDSNDEIILSVSDSSNNIDFKTIKVNRVDNEKPVIKLKGSSYMFIEYGNRYVEPGYEISDNCSQFANLKVKVSGSVGMDKGTYVITYELSDESGNRSSVSRKIVVGEKIVDNGVVNNGVIYLTFDDGPNYGTTDKILDILKEEGVKATFFVTNRGPDSLIKRMHDEGHTVALHTATHEYSYVYSSVDNYFNDLNSVRDRVKRITGVDSKIIRFPGGSSNMVSRNYKVGIMSELTTLVLNQGYRYFDWNVDSMDASSARSGSDVYYNVVSGLSRNRSNVVLMHDIKSITVNGLRDIIKYGKNSGYKFSNIDMNTYMIRHSVNN